MNQFEPIFFTPPSGKTTRARTLHKGGGDSPSNVTQTTTTQLPGYAQGTAQDLLSRATALSNREYTPYSGQRIADLNQFQQNGINMVGNNASGNIGTLNNLSGNLNDTISGKYMDISTNPYWKTTSDAITTAYNQGTRPQTDSAFARSGAFGGSAYENAVKNNQIALGNSLTNAAGQLYNQERGNQFNAMGMIPSLLSSQNTNAQNLIGAGDILRSYQQDLLNQNLSDWTAAQNQPLSNLDILAKALAGSVGGAGQSFTTGPNPYQSNSYANMLGAGLTGMGLLNMMGQ